MITEEAPAEASEQAVDQVADSTPEGTQEEHTGPYPWQAQMKGDLKEDEYFHQFKTLSDVGTSLLDMRKKLESSVVMPGEEPEEEEIKEFYTKLGRPETAEEYKFEQPELPKGLKLDPSQEEAFKMSAYESGLTQPQAAKFYKEFIDTGIKGYQEAIRGADKRREAAMQSLKDDWGEGFKENSVLAGRAVKQFWSEEDQDSLGKELENNPVFLNGMHRIGKAISEDKFIDGQGVPGEFPKSNDGYTMPSYAKK